MCQESVWGPGPWLTQRIGCGHSFFLTRQEQKLMIDTTVLPPKANGLLQESVLDRGRSLPRIGRGRSFISAGHEQQVDD